MIVGYKKLVLLTACLCLFACGSESTPGGPGGASNAQSTDGFIEGTLNGEVRKWYITSGEANGMSGSQSSWESFAGMNQIKLFGHARSDTVFDSKEALMIIITTSSLDSSAQVLDSEVVYLSGSLTTGYGSNEGAGNSEIVLDGIQSDGTSVQISGRVDADLVYRSLRPSSETPAQQSMKFVDGRFQATVREQQ